MQALIALTSRSLRTIQVAALGVLSLVSAASADTVWVRSGAKGNELDFPNVKVQKVTGTEIVFSSDATGRETRRGLDSVSRILLDDEPPFSGAEAAYDKGDLKGSIDGYQKAISASTRDWVKTRSALRLIEAGNKTGSLTAGIAGYASLAVTDPTAAQGHPPTIPTNASKADLDAAIEAVKSASTAGKLAPEQQKPLLALLQQLYTANKDTASAGKVLEKLENVSAAAASAGGTQDAADTNRVKGQVKLNDARAAMAAHNYPAVISAIQDNSSLFTDPAGQDECSICWQKPRRPPLEMTRMP